jgi:hypothetical protein
VKKFLVALALSLALFLTACGVDAGNVYAKNYYPEHYKTVSVDDYAYLCQYEYDYMANGGKGGYRNVCKNRWTGSHNEQRVVPACWEVKFKNEEGDKGKQCVGQETYDNLEIGDWYEK